MPTVTDQTVSPQIPMLKPSVPQNGTVFGDKVFKKGEEGKMRPLGWS